MGIEIESLFAAAVALSFIAGFLTAAFLNDRRDD